MSAILAEIAPYAATCAEAEADPAWDALVEATPGGDLAQTTLWAATRRLLGFRCLRIMVTAPDPDQQTVAGQTVAGQTVVGGCLLYAKRMAPGVWAGSVPRGPLLFAGQPQAAAAVVREVAATARRRGVHFLVMQPPEGAAAIDAAMTTAGFRLGVPSVAPEATLRLDPRSSDDALLAAMSRKRRQVVRKALQVGFEWGEERDVEVFHRLHAATAARQGFSPISLRNLQAQYDVLAPRALCAMFIARYGGVPVAGHWVTRFAGTVTSKLSGWDATAAAPRDANLTVLWAAIQWARAQGAHTYDFGGFDRRGVEILSAGEPLPEDFVHLPCYAKLGLGGRPVLLPQARFVFTHRLTNRTFGGAAQRFFTTPGALRFVQRLRNG